MGFHRGGGSGSLPPSSLDPPMQDIHIGQIRGICVWSLFCDLVLGVFSVLCVCVCVCVCVCERERERER